MFFYQKTMRILLSFLIAGGIAMGPFSAMATDGVLPSDVFTAIMLKSLNYDRNIDRIAESNVVIGIVYMADDLQARDFANQVNVDILKAGATFKLKGREVNSKVISVEKDADKTVIEKRLRENHVSALVVAVRENVVLQHIFEVTRELRVNSVCYESNCLQQGAGLGIVVEDNKPKMLINLAVVKQEGSDYGGKFLALCEIIK